MPLTEPIDWAFERAYKSKFEAMGSHAGVKINYDQDIAALDLGIHLTFGGTVTSNRAWFQLKGIRAGTLVREDFERTEYVHYSVKIEHLRAWYQAPEAVYLVIYIESANLFLAEDVRDIVRRQWGDELLNDAMFKPDQVSTTVKVAKVAQVNDPFWDRLRKHRSMRTDGRMFRGRPLGHDFDPLRTTLNPMEPRLFDELVRDLLSEHGYRPLKQMDARRVFPGASEENLASLECGILHAKFEIVLQLTTEMIPDEVNGFLIEGDSDFAQGPCAVLIHSRVAALPNADGLRALSDELSRKQQIDRLLVFINSRLQGGAFACFGAYVGAVSNSRFRCRPQHLEEISLNFLTTMNTYLRFRDKVSYFGGKMWRKTQGPLFLLPPEGGPAIPFE